jgi:hypothetical protein
MSAVIRPEIWANKEPLPATEMAGPAKINAWLCEVGGFDTDD